MTDCPKAVILPDSMERVVSTDEQNGVSRKSSSMPGGSVVFRDIDSALKIQEQFRRLSPEKHGLVIYLRRTPGGVRQAVCLLRETFAQENMRQTPLTNLRNAAERMAEQNGSSARVALTVLRRSKTGYAQDIEERVVGVLAPLSALEN